jgi:hypothetical protein
MPLYLVERVLPGATMEQVEGLHATLERACSLARKHGTPITYLRSLYTPGESRCRCLFAAPSAEAVRELNDTGGLTYSRIVVAVELLGEALPSTSAGLSRAELSNHPVHEAKERSR